MPMVLLDTHKGTFDEPPGGGGGWNIIMGNQCRKGGHSRSSSSAHQTLPKGIQSTISLPMISGLGSMQFNCYIYKCLLPLHHQACCSLQSKWLVHMLRPRPDRQCGQNFV